MCKPTADLRPHLFPLFTACTLLVPTMSCKVHHKPHYFKGAISSLPQDTSCPIPIPTAPRELSMAWGATAPHLHGEVSLQLSVRGGCRGRKRLPVPEQAVEEILHAHGAILVQAVEHPLEHLRAAGGRNFLVIAKSTAAKTQHSRQGPKELPGSLHQHGLGKSSYRKLQSYARYRNPACQSI